MKVIDFHTHAFPDGIATNAVKYLEEEVKEFLGPNFKAYTHGTVNELLKSMDRANIEQSIICSIATRPAQVEKITDWSKTVLSERIIPFASIHPLYDKYNEELKRIKDFGIKGIKLHPYYQDFVIDDEKYFPLYEAITKNDIILMFHGGYDIAFKKDIQAEPQRLLKVHREFPELKLIGAHLGGYDDFDRVKEYLIGEKIYLDTSFTFTLLSQKEFIDLINNHDENYILFGTDSPWADQKKEVEIIRSLELDQKRIDKILFKNAERLLFN